MAVLPAQQEGDPQHPEPAGRDAAQHRRPARLDRRRRAAAHPRRRSGGPQPEGRDAAHLRRPPPRFGDGLAAAARRRQSQSQGQYERLFGARLCPPGRALAGDRQVARVASGPRARRGGPQALAIGRLPGRDRGRQVVKALGPAFAASLALVAAAAPVAAQPFPEGYTFIKAVRDHDATKVRSMLAVPGTIVINAKDLGSGDAALHILARERDYSWLSFMLGKGANPNIQNRNGETPLSLAAQIGWTD